MRFLALCMFGTTAATGAACLSETPASAIPQADLQVSLLDLQNGALANPTLLRIHADRPLEPGSVLRQSFAIVDLGTGRVLSPPVRYEPVARDILVDLVSPGLSLAEASHTYALRVWAPTDTGVLAWLRGVDNTVLSRDAKSRSWTFRVDAPLTAHADDPTFCRDVLPLLSAHCIQCHAGSNALMGMDLSSQMGLRTSAFGVPATLARRTPGLIEGTAPLGTQMTRIAPGNAGISMLVYKTLLAPAWDETEEDIRARTMLDTVIPGRPMGQLTQSEKRVLSTWVLNGARAEACSP